MSRVVITTPKPTDLDRRRAVSLSQVGTRVNPQTQRRAVLSRQTSDLTHTHTAPATSRPSINSRRSLGNDIRDRSKQTTAATSRSSTHHTVAHHNAPLHQPVQIHPLPQPAPAHPTLAYPLPSHAQALHGPSSPTHSAGAGGDPKRTQQTQIRFLESIIAAQERQLDTLRKQVAHLEKPNGIIKRASISLQDVSVESVDLNDRQCKFESSSQTDVGWSDTVEGIRREIEHEHQAVEQRRRQEERLARLELLQNLAWHQIRSVQLAEHSQRDLLCAQEEGLRNALSIQFKYIRIILLQPQSQPAALQKL
eukprot:TRINITY_DN19012_c0_g1_i1.p1 TRINITY_DN19012_c0_g1~~TRINITY_DN19012_c0_g1_i1.p1  ORF type:complete len:308 (+),score=32.48 TRINITY_DN19012_c0_g1_i1:59-982(+)